MELQHLSDKLKILKCFNFTARKVRYIQRASTNFPKIWEPVPNSRYETRSILRTVTYGVAVNVGLIWRLLLGACPYTVFCGRELNHSKCLC
jgi:hypothetical protein